MSYSPARSSAGRGALAAALAALVLGAGASAGPAAGGSSAAPPASARSPSAGVAATLPREPPVALVDRDHPLVGRIWSTRDRAFVDEAALQSALRGQRFVLLGERHGNPEHHRLQARLIAALPAPNGLAVVAEQLDFPQQPAVDACRADCTDFGVELGARVEWAKSGWPDYGLYSPVFAAAAAAGASVLAGNPGSARVRAMSRGEPLVDGESAWVEAARTPLAPNGRERLIEALVDGHCGHLPPTRTEPLITAQRLRDAALAATLERGAGERGTAVLVAGTGHARRDYGVPTLLREPRTLVVAFAEVAPGVTSPVEYAPPDAYDFLWFTPRVDEPDPCEQFRPQLRKLAPGQ